MSVNRKLLTINGVLLTALLAGGVAYAREHEWLAQEIKAENQAKKAGPSFDCSTAKLASEKFICSDNDLSKTDKEMAGLYGKLMRVSTLEEKTALKKAQRQWLLHRDQQCSNVTRDACEATYVTRLDEMSQSLGDRQTRLDEQGHFLCEKDATCTIEQRKKIVLENNQIRDFIVLQLELPPPSSPGIPCDTPRFRNEYWLLKETGETVDSADRIAARDKCECDEPGCGVIRRTQVSFEGNQSVTITHHEGAGRWGKGWSTEDVLKVSLETGKTISSKQTHEEHHPDE